uniref:Uncharacterized protein n=1 Tax=Laticauda laticaudata TaxID=8630 RepID=A0A8C5S2W0_LATLA
MERYGGIDILVCNAAVNPFFGNMLDASEERRKRWLISNLFSHFSSKLDILCDGCAYFMMSVYAFYGWGRTVFGLW